MGTGDEHDGSTHDEDRELIAPVVPLRRRHGDAPDGDTREDEATAHTQDEAPTAQWSVFDPPRDHRDSNGSPLHVGADPQRAGRVILAIGPTGGRKGVWV
jgi:hypothetical protein